MGYGFKIGGKGIILKPPKLELSVQSLAISGAELTKTFIVNWSGDGVATITSLNTNVITVSPSTLTESGSTVTVTFVAEGSADITVALAETKHYLSEEATFPVTCTRSNPTLTLSTGTLTINGASPSGSFLVSKYTGDGSLTAASGTTTVCTVNTTIGTDKKINVTYLKDGTSVITVTAGQTDRYNSASKTCTVTCNKSDPTYTPPTKKTGLTYTRSDASTKLSQALLNAGTVTSGHGTMYYSTDNSNWSTTVPSRADAATYTVYYKVTGNNYYNDVASKSIDVTIAKRSLTKPALVTASYSNTTSTSRTVTSNSNYNSYYEYTGGTWTATNPGTYTVSWTLRDTTNTKWSDDTTAAVTQNWTITYYVYNRQTSLSGTGCSAITFVGNNGAKSGNYCYYESAEQDILMENKGSNNTSKSVTFTLNAAIPSGKTVYVNMYCQYDYTPADVMKTIATVSLNSTNKGSWTWPTSTVSVTTSESTSTIKVSTSSSYGTSAIGNIHILQIYVR